MKPRLLIKLSALLIVAGYYTNPVFATLLSSKELEKKIEASGVVRPGERISLGGKDDEVIVHKYRAKDSTDTEKDCKIEAVLISKAVMDADNSVKKVKTRFFEPLNPSMYSEVLVGLSAIKAYATGVITQEDLLASLELNSGVEKSQSPQSITKAAPSNESKVDHIDLTGVVDGPLKDERAKLLSQIKQLHDLNVNTKAYTEQFSTMEEKVQAGDSSETATLLIRLKSSVESQLNALAQKGKRPATGGSQTSAGSGEQDSDSSSMKAKMYEYSKKKYGNFAAPPGPYESDRGLIAAAVLHKKKYGLDVSADERMCVVLNNLAIRGDKATLAKKIPVIFQYLHITQSDVDKWRISQKKWQQNMEMWGSYRRHHHEHDDND